MDTVKSVAADTAGLVGSAIDSTTSALSKAVEAITGPPEPELCACRSPRQARSELLAYAALARPSSGGVRRPRHHGAKADGGRGACAPLPVRGARALLRASIRAARAARAPAVTSVWCLAVLLAG